MPIREQMVIYKTTSLICPTQQQHQPFYGSLDMCTKSDNCSFSRSRVMVGAPKFKIVHMTVNMPICRPEANTSYGQPVYKI